MGVRFNVKKPKQTRLEKWAQLCQGIFVDECPSLFDAINDQHMINTGSMDCYDKPARKALLKALRWRLKRWELGPEDTVVYDNAVRKLLETVLEEVDMGNHL